MENFKYKKILTKNYSNRVNLNLKGNFILVMALTFII